MRIYVIYRGPFGEQMVNNIAARGFADNIVAAYELKPETIEQEHPSEADLWDKLWEYPEHYVPKDMPLAESDLLLVLGIHSKLGDLIPPIVRKLGAKAVLYPIDDKAHAPEAKKTIEEELVSQGVHVEFPEPFCLLEASENELVRRFAERFGRPKFDAGLDTSRKTVKEIDVIRDTPCGSAHCVAEKLRRNSYQDERALAERILKEHNKEGNENYCLAEMDPHHPMMQEAGDILKEAFFEAFGLDTLDEIVMRKIQTRDGVALEELKETIVDQERLCEAKRTVERCVDKLVEQGRIIREGMKNPRLGVAQRLTDRTSAPSSEEGPSV